MTTGICELMGRKRNLFIGAALGLLIALTGNPAIAADQSGNSPEGAGLQAVSWLTTIPYGAVKVAFALTGGIVGGLTWAATGGNTATAKAIWTPTMTGDYIVQPQHLTGEKRIHFVGGSSDKPKA